MNDAAPRDPYGPGPGQPYGEPQPAAKSHPLALAIVVLGLLGFGGCGVAAIVAAIAIPNLVQARQAGNESAAIGALKALVSAQALFREADKDGDGVTDYGDLRELGDAELIDLVLASGTKQGYHFEVHVGSDPELTWWANATPAVPDTTGSRYFYVNQDGIILYAFEPIDGELDLQALPPGVAPLGR